MELLRVSQPSDSLNKTRLMSFLTGAERREWMGMGVARMTIYGDYGSFPHSPRLAPVSFPQIYTYVKGRDGHDWSHLEDLT